MNIRFVGNQTHIINHMLFELQTVMAFNNEVFSGSIVCNSQFSTTANYRIQMSLTKALQFRTNGMRVGRSPCMMCDDAPGGPSDLRVQ
jgi:hypothetical protein